MAGKRETDIGVKITGDASKFQKVASQVSKDVSKMRKEFHTFSTGISQLKGLVVGAFSVNAIANFTKESMKLSATMEGVSEAFNKIAKPGLLNELRTATRGAATDLVLMQKAVQASNFQIPLTQLADLFKFASARAIQTGQSVDYLVDSIITGIGRKSPLILDNLGISAVRLKEAMKGASTEMSTVGDFAKAVGGIATEELRKMGVVADTAATGFQKLGVATENLKTAWGNFVNNSQAVKKAVSGIANVLNNFAERGVLSTMFEKRSTWEKWKAEKEKWDIKPEDLPYVGMGTMLPGVDVVGQARQVNTVVSDLVAKIKEGAVESLNMARAWKVIKDEINATHRAAGLGKVSTDNLSIPTLGTKSQLAGLQKSNIDIKPFIDLEAQLDKDAIKANLLTDSIIGIGEAIGGMASGSVGAMKAMVSAVLSAVKQIVNAYLGQAIASMIKNEVGNKGIAGLVTAAVGVAALEGFWHSKVPEFATGTTFAPGGLALVGERGPEIVDLPRGSKVFPNGTASVMRHEVVGKISGRDLMLVARRNGF